MKNGISNEAKHKACNCSALRQFYDPFRPADMPLIDSDNWDSKFISLNQLHFHPSNPRLPELRDKVSEAEAIHELCQRADVQHIAKIIAEKGYFRNDRLIVVKEDSKFIVYEGNRRLAALKILAQPSRAPASMRRNFERLSERARLPKKVAVEVVPSRFDAEVVMYSKHVDTAFMVRWDPIQQATFIAAKLAAGESPESLMQTYGLSKENVIDARASVDLYRLARLAPLSPKAQELVNDPAEFPYSTIYERLFKPLKSRKALGARIDENGLVIDSSEESFLPILARILDDTAEKKIDTRKLNETDAQEAYVKKLKFTPDGGRLTADEAEARRKSSHAQQSVSHQTQPNRQQSGKTVRPTGKLFPRSLTINFQHEKLSRLLTEGKRLDVATPHACAFLMRTTLEISLRVGLKKRHLSPTVKNQQLGPTLAELLDCANKNAQQLGLDADGRMALSSLVSRVIKSSKYQLDRIVHDSHVIATPDDIVSIREAALPLLTVLLAK